MRRSSAIAVGAALLCLRAAASLGQSSSDRGGVKQETLALHDAARDRAVPVVVYADASPRIAKAKPAVISHGYGAKNTEYGFIARYLASNGFVVASVQHEIPGDEPLPKTGKPFETRMPSWERAVQNMLFVLGELKKRRPDLDYNELLLVGHSHGGDASMLFAQKHPELVHTVLSLDNRRMPFPRTRQPRIVSIRSADQAADEAVIPLAEEQAAFGMQVVKLASTKHDDMWDGATEEQKTEMLQAIARLLQPDE